MNKSKASGGKVGVVSLGCPKNLVDTETMLGRLQLKGYTLTQDPEEADVLVVNTCGFLAEAEAESRGAIEEMAQIKRDHPGTRLVVTGCLAQRHGEALTREMPDIDVLLGAGQYDQLIPMIEAEKPSDAPLLGLGDPEANDISGTPPRLLTTPPHTAYVRIAEGCNNTCAFCIIPKLRGAFRSRTPEDIEAEVQNLAGQGVKEINLVSQDTTLYGRDLSPRSDLAGLLTRLARVEGIAWIRSLYLYPTLITDELLQVMAREEKILPYLDIPLQHSHSEVLTRMRRAERSHTVERLVSRIHEHLPEAFIRTTFIVGFPGESEAEFQHLYDFIAQARFDHVGVFTYSDEEGTQAFEMPDKVPEEIAQERRHLLMTLQQEISREKLAARVGQTLPVLVDGISEEFEWLVEGRTQGQALEVDGVVHINDGSPEAGQIVQVQITDSHEYDLVGHVVEGA
ncbi:MAG: 30S ribosomal protein S12 methylthiotransferase RimO [Magnetococcales bacterium]|nr:30S ribosomal protein S12 methylthiotransferase RimO [Magnetococcales bacterium]